MDCVQHTIFTGIIYYELFPREVTNIAEIYCQQLDNFVTSIQRKIPKRQHQVILQRDNAATIQEFG